LIGGHGAGSDLSGSDGAGGEVAGLDRLDGDNLFRLTEPSNKPMWVLEASAKETRVVFVPAALARSSAK